MPPSTHMQTQQPINLLMNSRCLLSRSDRRRWHGGEQRGSLCLQGN